MEMHEQDSFQQVKHAHVLPHKTNRFQKNSFHLLARPKKWDSTFLYWRLKRI